MTTMQTRTVVGGFSPWGDIQTVRAIAHDLESVTTASHGGLWLGPERWMEVAREFPGFRPYAGAPWLEEDCDVTLAVLLWPELFEGLAVWEAVRSCHGNFGADVRAYVAGKAWLLAGSPRALAVAGKAEDWARESALKWMQYGGHTSGDKWVAVWRRVGDWAERVTVTRDIPEVMLATDAELDGLGV